MLPFAVVYAAAWFVVACRIATHLAWYWRKTENARFYLRRPAPEAPDASQWLGGGFCGGLLAILWPLVVAAYAGRRVLFRPPPDVRVGRDRERVKQLEAENASLDRQLRGILRDD
jgi:hypothetical protein